MTGIKTLVKILKSISEDYRVDPGHGDIKLGHSTALWGSTQSLSDQIHGKTPDCSFRLNLVWPPPLITSTTWWQTA